MKLHARYIAVLISCIVLFVGSNNVYAQTLPLQEIVAEMQRGLQLRNAKKYSEALEIFLRVGENTQLQKSVQEKEIFQTCQLFACSCYRELGEYEKGYDLAKRTLLLQLNENDKRRVSFEYVYCGYRMANALTKKADAGLVEYKTVRELLYELEPFADKRLKNYIVSAIPRAWYMNLARPISVWSTTTTPMALRASRLFWMEIISTLVLMQDGIPLPATPALPLSAMHGSRSALRWIMATARI